MGRSATPPLPPTSCFIDRRPRGPARSVPTDVVAAWFDDECSLIAGENAVRTVDCHRLDFSAAARSAPRVCTMYVPYWAERRRWSILPQSVPLMRHFPV